MLRFVVKVIGCNSASGKVIRLPYFLRGDLWLERKKWGILAVAAGIWYTSSDKKWYKSVWAQNETPVVTATGVSSHFEQLSIR